MQTYEAINKALISDQLEIVGAIDEGSTTLFLIGPTKDFWPHFKTQSEYQDTGKDPIDRWSTRVLAQAADDLKAQVFFPFGGPPYQPFISWATQSGHTWSSPITLLVHDKAGLFISFRGALRFDHKIEFPTSGQKPCDDCAQPCVTACPVNALTKEGYDTDACHSFLNTNAGQDCMDNGCKARRVCPVSQSFARDPDQSAHHMSYFHKKGR